MSIKVGVRYCGGCNPNYDRVELVEDLKMKLQGKAEFTGANSEKVDLILAVAGCETACVDLSPFKGERIFVMTGVEGAHGFIELVGDLISVQKEGSLRKKSNRVL